MRGSVPTLQMLRRSRLRQQCLDGQRREDKIFMSNSTERTETRSEALTWGGERKNCDSMELQSSQNK